MNIKSIKFEADYNATLERVSELMDAKANSLEGDELDVLSMALGSETMPVS